MARKKPAPPPAADPAAPYLADLCENPDDETTRKIFADWLEDHDQEARGNYFRLEEAAHGGDEDAAEKYIHLVTPEVKALCGENVRLRYDRASEKEGCVTVVMPFYTFTQHATALAQRFGLRSVELGAWQEHSGAAYDMLNPRNGYADRMASCGGLAYFSHMKIANSSLSNFAACAVAACPHAKNIAWLDLDCHVENETFQAFAGRKAEFPKLRALSLRFAGQGNRPFSLLAQSFMPQLARLEIKSPVDAAALNVLLAASPAGKLEALSLHFIMESAVDVLAKSKHLGGLKQLLLGGSNTKLKSAECGALAKNACLSNIEELELEFSTAAYHRGAALCALVTALPRLHTLRLPNQRVSAQALENIAATPTGKCLRTLDLSNNSNAAGDSCVQAIAAGFPQLETLNLSNIRNLTTDGITALLRADSKLDKLRNLSLAGSNLTKESAEALANAPKSRQLQRLDLQNNRLLGDAEIAPLMENLTELRALNVRWTSFSAFIPTTPSPRVSVRALNAPCLIEPGARMTEYAVGTHTLRLKHTPPSPAR